MEKVVAAAVVHRGKPAWLPRPARHHDVIRDLASRVPESEWPVCGAGDGQGFMTDAGRYVGRSEAGRIALAAGQVDALAHPPLLYSEDLW